MKQLTNHDITVIVDSFKKQLGERQIQTGADVFCATISAILLSDNRVENFEIIVDSIFSKETALKIKRFIPKVYELRILCATMGKDTLFALINSDEYKVLGMDVMTNQDCLNKLLLDLHHLDTEDSYMEYGLGIGNNFIMANERCKNVKGVDISSECVTVTEIRRFCKEYDNIVNVIANENDLPAIGQISNVSIGNIETMDLVPLKADKTIVDLGFGMKNSNRFKHVSQPVLMPYADLINRGGWANWTYALTAFLNNPEGRVIAVMESAALFREIESGIRQTLANQGFIEGIIDLPANLFKRATVKVSLVILSQGNDSIRLLDASDIYTPGRRINTLSDEQIKTIVSMYDNGTEKCITVSIDEVANNDSSLLPSRYMEIEKPTFKAVTLNDVCIGVERGCVIGLRELEELTSQEPTNIKYLMLKDILDGRIADNLPSLTILDKKREKYCINDGEIIMSKISPFKVGLATVKNGERILASGNLYRIQLDTDKVNPLYVYLFLRSEAGMKQINAMAYGGVTQSISLKDIRRVLIPDISKSDQDRIVEEYKALEKKLADLEKQKQGLLKAIDSLITAK